jgi:hypothetical protein
VILRRRDDTFERVIREHLRGELFARKGNVDKYFERKARDWRPWDDVPRELTGDARIAAEKQALALWMDREFAKHEERIVEAMAVRPTDTELAFAVAHIISYRRDKMLREICEHIRTAPEREAVALRAANTRQGIERLWRTRGPR